MPVRPQDSTGLGVKLEKMTWGSWTPHKFKMAVSGCPRNCAEATIKDFGVVCVDSGYEIHVGGNGGIKIRGTDLLYKLATEAEVKEYCCAFMQLYREEGRYLERTAPWIERVGLSYVKSRIVEGRGKSQGALRPFSRIATICPDRSLGGTRQRTRGRPRVPAFATSGLRSGDHHHVRLARNWRARRHSPPGFARGANAARRRGGFRTADDQVFALRDRCPHKGGPLSQGIVHGHRITCPLHNWVLELESGQAVAPDVGCATHYPVRLGKRSALAGLEQCGQLADHSPAIA